MDRLEFTASIIRSLAWPSAVVIVALSQRKAVGRFIDKIKSAKVWGAEVSIGEQIEAAQEQVEAALPASQRRIEDQTSRTDYIGHPESESGGKDDTQPPSKTVQTPPVLSEAEVAKLRKVFLEEVSAGLADASPAGAILAAWLELERRLRELGSFYGIAPMSDRPNSNFIIRKLRERKLISQEAFDALRATQHIRNSVAHGEAAIVTPEDARSYRAMIDGMLQLLSGIAPV